MWVKNIWDEIRILHELMNKCKVMRDLSIKANEICLWINYDEVRDVMRCEKLMGGND